MAMSNRDRVSRGFDNLADGLLVFVDRQMSDATDGFGEDWIETIRTRDESKLSATSSYDKNDPGLQLRMIADETQIFGKLLNPVQQSLASELREVRNEWAHNKKFNNDDTYRILDTMERLLLATGSPYEADLIRQLRQDHQRVVFESETKKAILNPDSSVNIAGTGLKSWREVLRPHEDVATGNYSASEFAADLYMVSQNQGSSEYIEPIEFFRRTYLTEGLRELLDRGIRRVSGDENASPIINLQTNFGGGKTHSMLALWHLFGGAPTASLTQEVQDVVANRLLPKKVNRVALVGIHLSPGAPLIKEDGTRVNTVWGELAWQLGGKKAFDFVSESDASRTSPGEGLRKLILAYSPCLILIDEWVAYARQLWEREDLPGGTFDTQFTFAQSLTEIVKTVPGAMLVISIPASHDPDKDGQSGGSALEVGGPNGQEALQRLQNVVRRVADQWRPASAQESFEIVRRRLFVEPDSSALADIAAVARQFVNFYAQHSGEFPKDCSEIAYEARIRAAYPIHPELFDRLYEDWSTLERFQRTRGVLRLMSAVVHTLWESQDAGPLIMPGSLPLDVPRVLSEITQYLPDSWKPIVDADIDGASSTPVQIDSERVLFGQRALTRRLARTIFIGAAPTLKSNHIGTEKPRIWLGVAIPGDTVGNFGSALDLLSQRATYLYADGHRYWFDTQASVTRTATDYADRLRDRPEEVWLEIVSRLRSTESKNRGTFTGVHIAPDSSADIPDDDTARLVIIHPSHTHAKNSNDSSAMKFARESIERRGSAQRINKNMLVYLAPDAKRLEELMEAVRDLLAWRNIASRIEEMNLSPQQAKQATTRRDQAIDGVASRLSQTFIWVIVPEQTDPSKPIDWTVEKADGQETALAVRTSERLIRSGLLTSIASPRMIRMDLDTKLAKAWESGHIQVGQLWNFYCSYPYLTRLKNRDVLAEAISESLNQILFDDEGFALAEGIDDSSGLYQGLILPGPDSRWGIITDQTLLVKPRNARAQTPSQTDLVQDETAGKENPASEITIPIDTKKTLLNTRFFGVYSVDPERYSRDLNKLSQEILQHLSSIDGISLDISVEIHASVDVGFSSEKIRLILENARSLKFKNSAFEVD
jgi:predicted AAA+ superfamily ATPase